MMTTRQATRIPGDFSTVLHQGRVIQYTVYSTLYRYLGPPGYPELQHRPAPGGGGHTVHCGHYTDTWGHQDTWGLQHRPAPGEGYTVHCVHYTDPWGHQDTRGLKHRPAPGGEGGHTVQGTWGRAGASTGVG